MRRAGFEVTAVDDGAPAIALADAAFAHDQQRYRTGVYCAVPSGEDDAGTREACLAAGADEVFCKPVPAVALRRRLTEVALALRGSAAGERSV